MVYTVPDTQIDHALVGRKYVTPEIALDSMQRL